MCQIMSYTDIALVAVAARPGYMVIDRLGRRAARHGQRTQGTTSQSFKKCSAQSGVQGLFA